MTLYLLNNIINIIIEWGDNIMHNEYLGLKAPMGWNTWNTFGENINEDLIKKSADIIVESGLKDAGYEYIVIDDCWSLKERDQNGRLVADPEKFPSGMKALADYIHSKGLKFGMYSCNGPLTCAEYPGSFDHEFVDAETFAEWGVDFLKYDNCFKPKINGDILYRRMAIALRNCGRDILFSACNWGAEHSEKWINSTGAQAYRSTGDIRDAWWSIKKLALSQIGKITHSGPFCHNDIDMLVVGIYGNMCTIIGENKEFGCTDLEYRTHFAFWCFMNSPLMIGCDIRDMNEETLKILTNADLIAINQDIESRNPFYLGTNPDEPSECFQMVKMLSNGDIAIGFFNFSDKKRTHILTMFDIGLPYSTGKALKAYDCVTGEDVGVLSESHILTLEAHDCRIYRCKLIDR